MFFEISTPELPQLINKLFDIYTTLDLYPLGCPIDFLISQLDFFIDCFKPTAFCTRLVSFIKSPPTIIILYPLGEIAILLAPVDVPPCMIGISRASPFIHNLDLSPPETKKSSLLFCAILVPLDAKKASPFSNGVLKQLDGIPFQFSPLSMVLNKNI